MVLTRTTTNDRGTTRPQQGLERFSSRLIAKGVVLPPRDLARMHAALAARGAAFALGQRSPEGGFAPLDEPARVAARIRSLLGMG